MSRIRFNLRNKKQKISIIYLIYEVNGERLVYSTKEKVSPKDWNDSKMEVKSSAGKEKAGMINAKLNLMQMIIYNTEAELFKVGERSTRIKLKQKLDHELYGSLSSNDSDQVKQIKTLDEYILWFIRDRRSNPNFKTGTIKTYKVFQKHWRRYAQAKRTYFESLDIKLLEGFIRYLIKHKNNYSDNHINQMVKIAKVILNDACERGMLKRPIHKSRLFRHSSKPTDHIYLTVEELMQIAKLKLPLHQKIYIHRDLFIVGAFTGLRFSDFVRIKKDNIVTIRDSNNIKRDVLKIYMKKVNDHVFIPIHPVVKTILSKHNNDLSQYKVVNQVINRDLKKIGSMAGINETIVKVIYRKGNADRKRYKKYALITTHTARRSFATNAYKSGIPAISIMKITGHKKSETFMKYICINEEENAHLLSENSFFK